ncbi:hypothetical protein CVT26_012808 [Gymnopilus dilepis]|uniref:Uncharacterized protein n=1 Tax=Gymnopilus dilepis TaxID=231916 RepID=A0A409Y431_9AGAR|nr:hypothetical protein CVT26_012808 [Gymnopilus dilepis]
MEIQTKGLGVSSLLPLPPSSPCSLPLCHDSFVRQWMEGGSVGVVVAASLPARLRAAVVVVVVVVAVIDVLRGAASWSGDT